MNIFARRVNSTEWQYYQKSTDTPNSVVAEPLREQPMESVRYIKSHDFHVMIVSIDVKWRRV